MTESDDDFDKSFDDRGGHSDEPPKAVSSAPRGRKRAGRWNECHYHLVGLLKTHGHISADGAKRISFGTSRSRRAILKQGFKYLHSVHMGPRKPHNFKPKHMKRLVRHWEDEGLSASTLQLRFSIFSTFCTWIGKRGMLGDISQFLKNPGAAERSYVAKEDKSWCAKGVEPQAKFAEVAALDQRVAIALKVMHAFGSRVEEAVQLDPKCADRGSYLNVVHGTKGGLPRKVAIETAYQRQVLNEAKAFANRSTGSLIPDTWKRVSWIKHCYEVFNACGIGRKYGIVPHGLRHQRANDIYENLTGEKSPVRGGATPTDEQKDKHARRVIAHELGHARMQIAGHYCGGRKKRRKTEPEKK